MPVSTECAAALLSLRYPSVISKIQPSGLLSMPRSDWLSYYSAICYSPLGYLKDSNAAAHSVDTGIECPMYMLENTRIFAISL